MGLLPSGKGKGRATKRISNSVSRTPKNKFFKKSGGKRRRKRKRR